MEGNDAQNLYIVKLYSWVNYTFLEADLANKYVRHKRKGDPGDQLVIERN